MLIGIFLVVVFVIIGIKVLSSGPPVHGDLVAVSDKLFGSDTISIGKFSLVPDGKYARDFPNLPDGSG